MAKTFAVMPPMKRPAGAAGLVALEMIKRAVVENQQGNLAGVPQYHAGHSSNHRCSPAASAAVASKQQGSTVATRVAKSAQRGRTERSVVSRQCEDERTAVDVARRLLQAASPGHCAEQTAVGDLAKRFANQKEVADAATKQVIAAEARAAVAEREVVFLHEKVQDLVTSSKEITAALVLVEKQISRAEGRAEVLGEQTRATSQALERAARAEERTEVMTDLQKQLPFLIRAVTGSLAKQGWPATLNTAFPNAIKLEYEDDKCALAETIPYANSDSATQQFGKSKHPVLSPELSQVATSDAKTVPADFKTPGNISKTGMMQRMVTAIKGGKRQLKV